MAYFLEWFKLGESTTQRAEGWHALIKAVGIEPTLVGLLEGLRLQQNRQGRSEDKIQTQEERTRGLQRYENAVHILLIKKCKHTDLSSYCTVIVVNEFIAAFALNIYIHSLKNSGQEDKYKVTIEGKLKEKSLYYKKQTNTGTRHVSITLNYDFSEVHEKCTCLFLARMQI